MSRRTATPGSRSPTTSTAGPGCPDRFGRALRDLRISVTDRCNFRCPYCMPAEVFGRDFAFLPREEVLSFEEIARLATIFVGLGVHKLRITGGEPLVRRNLPALIGYLAPLRTADGERVDLTLTTNGSALKALAAPLAQAGLQRITVSLDSLDDEVFGAMNGVDFPVSRVLDGIAAAREAGLAPIKINTVVRRGMNEASILPLARWARDEGLILRFIEYMDVGHSNGWRLDDVVPADEILATIDAELPLEPVAANYRGEVAGRYRFRRRRRRARRDRVGHATVLRGLHARAAVGRGTPVHVPVRGRRHGPQDPAPGRRDGCRAHGADRGDLGRARRPLLGAAQRRDGAPARRWRCSPSGASPGSAPDRRRSSPAADARGFPRPFPTRSTRRDRRTTFTERPNSVVALRPRRSARRSMREGHVRAYNVWVDGRMHPEARACRPAKPGTYTDDACGRERGSHLRARRPHD